MTASAITTYAIVDIETNGGAPTGDNITEVAAILHDGRRELDRWVRLIRPCLLYTSPSPRDLSTSRMPSSA